MKRLKIRPQPLFWVHMHCVLLHSWWILRQGHCILCKHCILLHTQSAAQDLYSFTQALDSAAQALYPAAQALYALDSAAPAEHDVAQALFAAAHAKVYKYLQILPNKSTCLQILANTII